LNNWVLTVSGALAGIIFSNACVLSDAPITLTSASCSPFQLVFQGTMTTASGWGACAYAGSTWSFTVTR